MHFWCLWAVFKVIREYEGMETGFQWPVNHVGYIGRELEGLRYSRLCWCCCFEVTGVVAISVVVGVFHFEM